MLVAFHRPGDPALPWPFLEREPPVPFGFGDHLVLPPIGNVKDDGVRFGAAPAIDGDLDARRKRRRGYVSLHRIVDQDQHRENLASRARLLNQGQGA